MRKYNISQNPENASGDLPDKSDGAGDLLYLSAVNQGDVKTAQAMVYNAAKQSGLEVVPKEKLSTIQFYSDTLGIPLKIALQMADWDYISKSPYSFSFYSKPGKTREHTPEGILRVADHWNFKSHGEKRQSLLADTADVAEESKIYLFGSGENAMAENANGRAVRYLQDGNKIIPIAEGFNFDKTSDMQKAMQNYISLLDGEHFTIKEDNTDVYFDKTSATEYARSNDTKNLRNRHSKLFKAKAKAVAAVGSIIENAAGGREETTKAGYSKENKKGTYRRYDVEFGLPSGTSEVKIYTGELIVWVPETGNSTFYDITHINFSRKVRDTTNVADSTGPRFENGETPHQLPTADNNIPQLSENASDMDNNLRFSLADYDEQTQDDIIAILRPFVRQQIDMEPERYISYLKEKNVNIPDEDAAVFFRLAVIENDKAARERIKRARGKKESDKSCKQYLALRKEKGVWRAV